MNDKLLTYRYPRTLAEASSRYLCTADDAIAIHGPYRRPLVADTWIGIAATVVTLATLGASILKGVLS